MKCLCPFYTLGARFRTWGVFGVVGGGVRGWGGGGLGVSGGGGMKVNFIVFALVSMVSV